MKKIYATPYDNIQDILNGLTEPTTIYLKSGIYRQKLEILTDNVTFIGENRETTIISYDDYARKIHADGQEYNTFRTYALCVSGENARLENLTVENPNTAPETVGQCVALSVNAKSFTAENCDFKSTQDTLFLAPFPDDLVIRYADFLPRRQFYIEGKSVHHFKNCRVYGTVDYIFGCAQAYFTGCELISVNDKRGHGFVAAPAHPLAEDTGFVFLDCDFKDGGAGEDTVWLARPWRDFGKSVFIDCRLGNHIKPCLFDNWNDTNRDRTARFLYYNLKSGFPLAPVKWCRELTAEEAQSFRNRVNKAD